MPKFVGHSKSSPSKQDILEAIEKFGTEADNKASVMDHSEYVDVEEEANSLEKNGYENGSAVPRSASFSNSYGEEWQRLFGGPNYFMNLKHMGMRGRLRSSRFRSICWRLYMEVLPEDQSKWVEETRKWRQKYENLRTELIINPRKVQDMSDLSRNNPLSQDDESPWNQFFQDNELRLTITQDVIRTFPEIEFFHNEPIRELMIDILFCRAKSYEILSYKQGMHELLAPLIFVLHCDHQAFLHACELETTESVVKELLDPEYLEHDAFALFCQIMDTVEPWYQAREITPPSKAQAIAVAQPFARPQDLQPSNVIVNKLTRIQDYVLKKHDIELHLHMERLDIAPQIYGIRWLRLLFGREFPMQDLLVIWDAIFADGISFDLVDYIFVAMLLYIRDILLSSDYPACLGVLMRFPAVGDVHYLIDKAAFLRDPNIHPRPPNYTCPKSYASSPSGNSEVSVASSKGSTGIDLANKFKNSTISSFSTLGRKMGNRPKNINNHTADSGLPKSTSEPMNLQTEKSPVSENPRSKSNNRKGSTSSLSKLDNYQNDRNDLMVRSADSSAMMARLDSGLARSTEMSSVSSSKKSVNEFSPEAESNGRYATLPGMRNSRTKPKRGSSKGDIELGQDVALQSRINDMEAMCRYCSSKMDVHIDRLQNEVLRQRHLENEDEMYLSIAGLKQVRDILKGTLKFAQNMLDSDEIKIADDHFKDEHQDPEEPFVDPLNVGQDNFDDPLQSRFDSEDSDSGR